MFVLLSEPRAHRLLLQNNCLVRSSADLMTELYKMMTIHFCCCLFYTSWNITIICKCTNWHFVVADVHTSHFILILLSSFRNSGSETSITTESWVWSNLSSALLRGHLNLFVCKKIFLVRQQRWNSCMNEIQSRKSYSGRIWEHLHIFSFYDT